MNSHVSFLQDLEQRYGKSSLDIMFGKIINWLKGGQEPEQPKAAAPYQPQMKAQEAPECPKATEAFSPAVAVQPAPADLPAGCLAITCAADWERYRDKAIQLFAIEDYLSTCVNEDQAAKISRILNQYREDVLKSLATPEEFDEKSNLNFLKALARIIENRLYTILKACSRKEGREKEFYTGLEQTLFAFFSSICLVDDMPAIGKKIEERFLEHCEIIPFTTNDRNMHMVLYGIIECPRYFTYLDIDNKPNKYYVEGCISLYKYQA